MEHLIMIAFWILTLCSSLQAKSVPKIDRADWNIPFMQKDVKCPNDSTFYAPENVKEECITTALDCVIQELNGRAVECEDSKNRTLQAVSIYKNIRQKRIDNGHGLTNSTDCACEKWRQTSFSEFLIKTERLLEQESMLSMGTSA